MNLFGELGTYLLVVIIGMVAVGIHARSLFGQQIPSTRYEGRNRVFASISILALGGRHLFYRGFYLYLIVSELAYLLLASSSVILEMTLIAIGRTELVGALTRGPQFNPLVPIVASTAIISASQIRPFSRIEEAVRSLAHAAAGIPRNVLELEEKITRDLDAAVLSARIEVKRSMDEDPAESPASRVSDLPPFERIDRTGRGGGVESANILPDAMEISDDIIRELKSAHPRTPLDEAEIERFRSSLVKVLCLHPWTLGYYGERIWTDQRCEEVLVLFRPLEASYEKLKSDLQAAQKLSSGDVDVASGGPDGTKLGNWKVAFAECNALEHRLTSLLALLLLNRPHIELHRYPTLDRVRRSALKPEPKPVANACALSIAVGGLLALLLTTLYFGGKGELKTALGSRLDTARLAPHYLDNEKPLRAEVGLFGAVAEWQRDGGVSKTTRESLDARFMAGAREWGAHIRAAGWEVVNYLIVFAASVSIALVLQRARQRSGLWLQAARSHVTPLLTYLSISSYAYLAAASGYMIANFIYIVVRPVWLFEGTSLDETLFSESNIALFVTELPRWLLFPFVCVICVWFVCSSLDRFLEASASSATREADDDGEGRRKSPVTPPPVASVTGGPRRRARPSDAPLLAKWAWAWMFTRRPVAARAPGTLMLMVLAVLFGSAVGLSNTTIRLAFGSPSNGWALLDTFLLPTLCFSVFFFTYAVLMRWALRPQANPSLAGPKRSRADSERQGSVAGGAGRPIDA